MGPTVRRWIPVDFPAWKYENTERLWAALAKSIYLQGQDGMSWPSKLLFRMRLERRRQGLVTFLAAGLGPPLLATFLLAVAVGTGLIGGATDSHSGFGALIILISSAAGAVGHYWGIVGQPFKRAIDSHSKQYKYTEQMGFTSEASNDIDALCEVLLRREDATLIVFVDDLDRCGSSNIVEVVEAVNQIFNSVHNRRCVFILGMDVEIVASSVDVAYDALVKNLRDRQNELGSSFGRSFLAKIVQMTVTLPAPSDSALRAYLAGITGYVLEDRENPQGVSEDAVEQLEEAIEGRGPRNPVDVFAVAQNLLQEAPTGIPPRILDEAIRRAQSRRFTTESPDVARAELEVLGHLEPNPRQVKRFDNAFRLQLHVASNTPGSGHHDFTLDQLVVLGKWVALRLRWPYIAAILDKDSSSLGRLEHAINTGSDSDGVPQEWLENADLQRLLKEPREARRLSAVPLNTFLRVT